MAQFVLRGGNNNVVANSPCCYDSQCVTSLEHFATFFPNFDMFFSLFDCLFRI
uniref:Uncharacterized protein n=1 Tax=Picea sitchensis TaxID=3332 RepID=A9NXS1_PICSI|nr:unknown [Picea sitchensis]